MELIAVGTFVLLLMEVSVTGVFFSMHCQVGLGGVALVTNITFKRLLTCVDTGVALVFTWTTESNLLA